ncbi:MAG: peroxiredoxin [Planctomycetes bacterium]|nr:peroxiredoxin [Planctomycetota bacterium]
MGRLGKLRDLARYAFGNLKRPNMLKVGDQAPDFEVQDHHGKTVRLKELAGKRVVLWFYPKADTPGCTKEGCGFRDQNREYEQRGIVVLGVSFDDVKSNAAFARKFSFPFRLLCDTDRKIGIAYKACETATDPYAKRYTYVIGATGKIEQAIDTKDPAGQAAALLALV